MLHCITELQHASVDFGRLPFSTDKNDISFIHHFSTKKADIRSIQPFSPEEDNVRSIHLVSTKENDVRSMQPDDETVIENNRVPDQETFKKKSVLCAHNSSTAK